MLKYGYLASNLVYVSIVHSKKVIDRYIYYLDKVFANIKLHQNSKTKYKILKGPIAHSTFKRLNN